MRRALNIMFKNKKLAIAVPIFLAAGIYLLSLLLIEGEKQTELAAEAPILSVAWFFGVFFVIYILQKNESCPEWFLNCMKLFVTVLSCGYTLFLMILLCIGGFREFNMGIYPGLITYSAVAWVHSKGTLDNTDVF